MDKMDKIGSMDDFSGGWSDDDEGDWGEEEQDWRED